jgi:hypothetical protein
MIYALSLLVFLLGLVLVIPAIRQLMRFRAINSNCRTITGEVISANSAMGWLWTAGFGSSTRPLIRYQTPSGNELNLEIVDSSMFTIRKYESGMSVDVIYAADAPGRAYARPQWASARQDLWLGIGALVAAAALWVIGAVYQLPF